MTVEIGGVDATLSSNPVIRDITLLDRDGAWLKIDRVSAHWSRLALLKLKLDIYRIEFGEMDVMRRPTLVAAVKTADATAKGVEKANASWRPDLPVRLKLGQFAFGKLVLAKPLFDMATTLAINGSAELGAARDNASFSFGAQRLDVRGTVSALSEFVPDGDKLRLKIAVSEPAGGLVARLAEIPRLPPSRSASTATERSTLARRP
jgi:translocation and assembly module TamB